jgi:predicted nucleotidyltransferase
MTDVTASQTRTVEWLRQHREEIIRTAAARGASNIRVFGSVARGEADSSSDVDLLVDLTTEVDGFAYFGLMEELGDALAGLLGCDVDVVELRGPFSRRGRQMAEDIRREAIPL